MTGGIRMLKAAALHLRQHNRRLDSDPELGRRLATWLETEANSNAGDEIHDTCHDSSCSFVASLNVAKLILKGTSWKN